MIGKRKHECPECKKSFQTPSKLQTHIDCVHLKLKKFKCPECEKHFGQKNNLKAHIKTVHEGRKDFVCNKCGKAFSLKYDLNNHIKMKAKEITNVQNVKNSLDKKVISINMSK